MSPKRRAVPPRVEGGLKNSVIVPINDTAMAMMDIILPLSFYMMDIITNCNINK